MQNTPRHVYTTCLQVQNLWVYPTPPLPPPIYPLNMCQKNPRLKIYL